MRWQRPRPRCPRVGMKRREPILDVDADDAVPCEIVQDVRIDFRAAIAMAVDERSAMDEHDDRPRLRTFFRKHVELLSWIVAVDDIHEGRDALLGSRREDRVERVDHLSYMARY